MKKHSYIGLGVHKESISIAVAEGRRNGEVREYGRVGGSLIALERALRKLNKPGTQLHCVYEAGPCGFVIYRRLKQLGNKRSGSPFACSPQAGRADQDQPARCH